MTTLQWIRGCDYYLLSLDHSYFPNLPSKMGLKKVLFTATIGMQFLAKVKCDVTESYLE